jgi:hypothetical protein
MAIKFDTFKTGGAGSSDVTSVNGEQGDVIVTLDSATDQGATTTNSITVGGLSVGTAYSLPTADGTANQSLITDGSGNLSFTTLDFTGGLEYKGTFNATAGTPSLANAEQGDYYKIDTAGTIYGQTWAVGDSLLINADMGGTITNSKIDKLDNTESVTSVNSQTGAVNLGAGDLSDVTITGAVNGEVLKYNGAAWVDANVDYTEVTNTPTNVSTFTNDANYVASGDNVSTLTNDAGYLTDITAEGLNDLSDVSFTAGVGIDGHVLTYDNTAGEWQAVAPASGGLTAVVQDSAPQLGGPLDVNGQEITSASNGNVVINPNGTGEITIGADVVPDADATHTIGSEDNRYITTFSDLNGAIRFKAKNDEGAQITKGQAVYIKGLAGDGTTPTVGLADANDASKMPAFGLAFNTANDQAEVQIVQVGNLTGLNTSGFSVGDTLYIDTTAGALVNTKPTGETSQLQNIGRVIRADNANGVIMVGGAGRSAATPNLDQNKIFLGNASNQSVSTALSSIALSSFNDDLSYLSSGDNISLLTNNSGYITDITGESLGDLSDVTVTTPSNGQVLSYNGTNWVNSASSAGSLSGLSDTTIGTPVNGEVLKYNGTAWVDAQLAYSELSGTPTNVSTFTNDANYVASGDNVSTLTNDAGYLTGITGESIGSLSDVTVTSATSGEVLKYNGSAWVDASVDYTEITNTPTNVSTFTNDSGYLTGITGESLGDLSDVTVTSAANGEVLKYNGTAWVNDTISAGGGYTFSAISSATTAQISYHYSCDTSGGAFTLTLPALSGVTAGQEIRVKLATAGNDLTIARTGSDTIDGLTSFTLSTAKSSITLVANTSGTDWEIV